MDGSRGSSHPGMHGHEDTHPTPTPSTPRACARFAYHKTNQQVQVRAVLGCRHSQGGSCHVEREAVCPSMRACDSQAPPTVFLVVHRGRK